VYAAAKSVLHLLRRTFRPAAATALLLMISYGALVETVHSHGPAPTSPRDVSAAFDVGGSQSADYGRSQHRECSMCQFQRQLIDGFVDATYFLRTPSAEIAFVFTPTILCHSVSTTPRSGRAPPLA